MLGIIIYLLISSGIFRFQASTANPAEYITAQAVVSYQNTSGASYTESSDILKIRKVTLFPIVMTFQGRNTPAKGMSASVDFYEREYPFSKLGSSKFVYDYDSNTWSVPDWTAVDGINPDQNYDLKISSPGYLSRVVDNQILVDLSSVAPTPLLAGDTTSDGNIKYDDYSLWNGSYGSRIEDSPDKSNYDYNADGVVNYKDFAIAFGSANFGKSVANQDN